MHWGSENKRMSACLRWPLLSHDSSIFIAKTLSLLILNIFILDVEQIELVFLPLYYCVNPHFSGRCGCL